MSSIQTEVITTITRNDGTVYQLISDKLVSSNLEVYDKGITIAAAATVLVWDPNNWTGFPISSFTHLLILAEDGDLELELTIGEGEADEELISMTLVQQVPLLIGSEVAFRNHGASDVFSGTLDVIDKVRVKNASDTDAVQLRYVMLAP